MPKGPKVTPTTRYIHNRAEAVVATKDGLIDGEGKISLHRLALLSVQPTVFTPEEIAGLVKKAPDDVRFYCDANMFIGPTHEAVWEALHERRLALTPMIVEELRLWLAEPKHNLAAHAALSRMQRNESSPYSRVNISAEHQVVRDAFGYYVNLLATRKMLGGMTENRLRMQLGREPTVAEVEGDLKRHFGERGYQRAKKGMGAASQTAMYADEELVTTAFFDALTYGGRVVIMTRDPDIQEQCFKLHWLLVMQYHAMCLAEAYVNAPGRFATRRMPKDDALTRMAFKGEDDIVVWCPQPMLTSLLPEKSWETHVTCWLLTGPDDNLKLTQDILGIERQMGPLLLAKGETGGLNTSLLDGRNCHVSLRPLSFSDDTAAIVTDNRIQRVSSRIPFLDIQHVLSTTERIAHLVSEEDLRKDEPSDK
jgi:hypothetical protein